MKPKLLLLSFVLFLTLIVKAQTSIAIQGIARDDMNRARANVNLSLTFKIYYKNKNTDIDIYSITQTQLTDNYGVFSTYIDPGIDKTPIITNNEAYLKISEGGTTISDEKLARVPYAIAASNGSPTGSIMPYIGAEAPAGWVLCNGQDLTGVVGSDALRAMLGSANAPNLQGMFLRGIGTNTVNNQSGPTLKATQLDTFKSHNHTGTTTGDGAHTHTSKYPNEVHGLNGDASHHNDNAFLKYGPTNEDAIDPKKRLEEKMKDLDTSSSTAHTHTIPSEGGNETRPVNYGVNYIIKL